MIPEWNSPLPGSVVSGLVLGSAAESVLLPAGTLRSLTGLKGLVLSEGRLARSPERIAKVALLQRDVRIPLGDGVRPVTDVTLIHSDDSHGLEDHHDHPHDEPDGRGRDNDVEEDGDEGAAATS